MLHRTSSLSFWRKQLPRGVESGLFRGLWDMGRKDRRINSSRVVEFSLLDTEGLFCPLPRFQKSQKNCIVLVHRQ